MESMDTTQSPLLIGKTCTIRNNQNEISSTTTIDMLKDCSPCNNKLIKTSDKHAKFLLENLNLLRKQKELLCDCADIDITRTIRHSASQIYGTLLNTHGNNWQSVADLIAKLTVIYGSIVKIELVQSNNSHQWLDIVIYYDHVDSAKRCRDHMETLGQLQSMNIWNLLHRETP